jgi:hypothetical protein
MNDSKFKQGDIVQVTNIHHPWFPALLVVQEVTEDTVSANAVIPTNDGVQYAPIQLSERMCCKWVGRSYIYLEK